MPSLSSSSMSSWSASKPVLSVSVSCFYCAVRFDALECMQDFRRLDLGNRAFANDRENEAFEPAENVLCVLLVPGRQKFEMPLTCDCLKRILGSAAPHDFDGFARKRGIDAR